MKQNYLERTYHLRTSDFDMRSRILPASVLDLFQDAAGEHAKMLGVGFYDLLPENKCWMILRLRYEVVNQPRLFSSVIVKTWPVESRRIEFDRDYVISDTEGNILIKGTSQWAILDVSNREKPSLVMAKDFDIGVEEYISERALEGRFERLPPKFEADGDAVTIKSGYTDIDTNGHVNNTKYSNFILNAIDLPAEKEIAAFRIDYLREMMSGTEISIYSKTDGDTVVCRGESDGSVNFTAKLSLK